MEFLILLLYYFVVGVPLYCIFYNIFNDSRPLFGIVFSILLGFIFYNLYQLIFGYIGCSLTGAYDLIYKISFLCICYGLYYINRNETSFKNAFNLNIKFSEISRLNLFLFTCLLLFYLYTLKIINVSYFIPWDVFHYWLLDPKIIYETGHLRQGVDLIDMHKDYGSFLSVSISDLYEIIGEIKERKAAYFTLLHAFFAGMILWQGISKRDSYTKLFGFSILLIVLSSFSWGLWFYSNYTEVHCAFYVLLFMYVLLSLKTYHPKTYYLRFVLLICVLYILVNVKPYYPQALFLIVLWATYDLMYFRKQIVTNYNLKTAIPLLILLFVLISTGQYYVSHSIEALSPAAAKPNFYGPENTLNIIQKVLTKLIPSSFEESKEIYGLFDNRLDRLIPKYTLLIVSIISIFFLNKKDFRIKFVYAALLGIFAIFLFYVVFYFPVKANNSFFRYSTMFFFLIPLVFSYKIGFNSKLESKIFSIVFITLALFTFFLSSFQPEYLSRNNHSGQFSSFPSYARYENIANIVKSKINPDDKVFVINGNKKAYVREKSVLMVRYNMIHHIVGGIEYQTRNARDFKGFLSNHKVDYLLIQNPNSEVLTSLLDTTFVEPNKNSFYLVKIDNLENDKFTITKIQ